MTKPKEETQKRKRQSKEGKKQKKPYSSPQLVQFGDVRKLTQGDTGPKGDAGTKRA